MATACLAAGILLAGPSSRPVLWPGSGPGFWPVWLVAAGALVAAAATVPARRHRVLRGVLMASAITGASAAWTTVRHDRTAATDLRTLTRGQAGVVRLSGTVVADPATTGAGAAVLARFHYRTSTTRFELDVDTVVDRTGDGHRASGRVLVRVADAVAPLNAGDRVRVTGMLLPPAPPRNPGTIDRRRTARFLGSAGLLRVPGRDLVVVERRGADPWRRGRAALRREAERLLLADLPGGAGSAERDALLRAMLLGRRDTRFGALNDAFRRVGLAHLLAISGLHLGVLVGLVRPSCRPPGAHRRRPQGLVVIIVVGAYLVLVEARLPVLRAGLMASAVGLGMIARRRWPTESLVLAAAMILLAWRPNELANPGFQLSFGVVLALLRGVPVVRRRWFAEPPGGAGTIGDVIRDSVIGSFCVAVVAWAVATPLVLRHFGMLSPGTVPLSVVSLPVASVTLVLGYVKVIAGALLPPAALLLAAPLAWSADLLRLLVGIADALPGSVLHLPQPGTPWTIAALAWSFAWMTGLAPSRRVVAAGAVVLVAWLAAPPLPWRSPPALRLDTLAVGNGACHVVRAGGRTLVFDAGSEADPAAGRRTILPALRAIGVRSIDVLCISHPNLDHFSAVPEIAAQLSVGSVLVTPLLLEAARAEPDGAVAALLDDLRARRVPVTAVAAGHRVALGRATARWLHPPADMRPERSNDGSMVVAFDAVGRRLLLTGDLEPVGIDALLDRHDDLRADVLELPHHGSFSEAARRLVHRLRPQLVVQSTGPARLVRDAWSDLPAGTRRVVTARDGAGRVVFPRDRRKPIEVGTWITDTDTTMDGATDRERSRAVRGTVHGRNTREIRDAYAPYHVAMRLQTLLLVLILAASCPGAGTAATAQAPPSDADETEAIPSVTLVAALPRLSFARPVQLTHAGDGTNRIFVVEQPGRIRVTENDPEAKSTRVFLDIKTNVRMRDNEEGLLTLAFHPEYRENGQLFVYYTASNPRRGVLSRFRVSPDDPDHVDPSTEEVILEVEQPYGNHNGGTIRFGPDGFLYLSLGDGGYANDPHGHGQNLSTLLGTVLRLDVDRTDDGRPYAIPADNPFVGRDDARGEIWAYGLRNLWRMSFDSQSGELWGGDVGQNRWEEIDLITKGGNYGWNIREGRHDFRGGQSDVPLVDPVVEYARDEGISVTGGVVYRGTKQPALVGVYLYADYATGRLWGLRHDGGRLVASREVGTTSRPKHITSFDVGPDGEVYVCAFEKKDGQRGKVYRVQTR